MFRRNRELQGGLQMCLNNGVWILCLKTIYGGVKIKTRHRNLPIQLAKQIQSTHQSFCLCVHVCAGWWSTASCQRHRDTTLIGTHGALVHHKQAHWLHSLALKKPSLQKRCSLLSLTDLLGFQLRRKIWLRPRFPVRSCVFPFFPANLLLNTHAQKCLWSFPLHKHLTNDERGDGFKPKTLFIHKCTLRKTECEVNGRWKELA